ncbi:unnamed protein product [marine sediment metagenome]|uniref:Uncharacterized protein n=1 Tax=marine sediment metagenome TaxID=412755 RepID=X1VYZ0_9ZZZZ
MFKIVEDVAVPLGVVGADFGTEYLDRDKTAEETKVNPIIGTALFAAGYILSALGIGGNYTKNMGIASMNWGIHSIKSLVETRGIAMGGRTSSRLAMHRKVASSTIVSPATTRTEETVSLITP